MLEVEVWNWSLKLRFEVEDNWSWRSFKLKNFEFEEIWSCRILTLKQIEVEKILSWINLKFEVEEIWNLKLKKFEIWGWRNLS